MRHNSVGDSSCMSAVRHSSLPSGLPDLSVMHARGGRPAHDAALRREGSYGARLRYHSVPFQGTLLSELNANRGHGADTRDNYLWASLSNPQARRILTGRFTSESLLCNCMPICLLAQALASQTSMARQVSSPASLLAREADSWPWGPAGNRRRVHLAQNPGIIGGASSQISNPFAQHGKA